MGVMGRNLLLNMGDHNFNVIGLDTSPEKIALLQQESSGKANIKGTTSAQEFVNAIRKPRAIMLLVPAGEAVDTVIKTLLPLLQSEDIIIDGGNSYYTDTERRVVSLAENKVHYFGMDISGGEKGARFGPSMMPGGNPQAYERVRPIFEAIAAKVNGEPCVTYLGSGSAGNYVKMVHNGIEYGIMQLIAEAYDVMKRGMNLDDKKIQQTFEAWNKTELQSFLVEITAEIMRKNDEQSSEMLVNMISDKAKGKGTGKWTSQNAMDLGVPVPTIDMAVISRDISAYKDERQAAASSLGTLYSDTGSGNGRPLQLSQLQNAFYFSVLTTYAQGFAQLHVASKTYKYGLNLSEVARIWRGGCIIRAACLENFRKAFGQNTELPNLLLDKEIGNSLINLSSDTRAVIKSAIDKEVPVPAMMASLSYFDAYKSAKLPTNLIQAQRDYFGAHMYERIDKEGVFHTQWI